MYDHRCGGARAGAGAAAQAVQSVVGTETFPGGHVEPGETVVASVIREVQEETGLTVFNLQNCRYIQWYNPEKQSQYFVFLFKTSTFSGELKGSAEGNVRWMTLDEMLAGKLALNMTKYLAVFQNENIPQAYGISGQGLSALDNNGKIQMGKRLAE